MFPIINFSPKSTGRTQKLSEQSSLHGRRRTIKRDARLLAQLFAIFTRISKVKRETAPTLCVPDCKAFAICGRGVNGSSRGPVDELDS